MGIVEQNCGRSFTYYQGTTQRHTSDRHYLSVSHNSDHDAFRLRLAELESDSRGMLIMMGNDEKSVHCPRAGPGLTLLGPGSGPDVDALAWPS